MKIIQLFNSQQWLNELIKCKMDIKKSYALRKFIIEIKDKLQAFSETREELIKKYWEEIEGKVQVKQENIQQFFTEINTIWDEEVTITIPEISIDDVTWEMSTDLLFSLDYIIK